MIALDKERLLADLEIVTKLLDDRKNINIKRAKIIEDDKCCPDNPSITDKAIMEFINKDKQGAEDIKNKQKALEASHLAFEIKVNKNKLKWREAGRIRDLINQSFTVLCVLFVFSFLVTFYGFKM